MATLTQRDHSTDTRSRHQSQLFCVAHLQNPKLLCQSYVLFLWECCLNFLHFQLFYENTVNQHEKNVSPLKCFIKNTLILLYNIRHFAIHQNHPIKWFKIRSNKNGQNKYSIGFSSTVPFHYQFTAKST